MVKMAFPKYNVREGNTVNKLLHVGKPFTLEEDSDRMKTSDPLSLYINIM